MAFQSQILNQAVPGASGLSKSASSIVGNLLSGLPGTSTARRSNAYFGQSSGVPGSEFVRNRGFDLYNQQGDQRQQTGIQDLLALLSGFSQPLLQERGQNIQSSQFQQSLAEQRRLEQQRQRAAQTAANASRVGVSGYPLISPQSFVNTANPGPNW